MLNQLFISYRHAGPDHARLVRRLGELLRHAKVPVALDQFYLDENAGGPDAGWPKWCEDNANESACVLIIASKGWFEAYNGTAPPRSGFGAATEAHLFRQALWDAKNHNARIRLAFVDNLTADSVPPRLRAWHQFRPFGTTEELEQLINWAAERIGLGDVTLPTVRWPEPLETFRPEHADREPEWSAIVDLLTGRSRERILLFQGESGLGKSALLRQAALYAAQVGMPVARIELRGGILDIAALLGQFELDLHDYLPTFTRDGSSKTHLLRKDLRDLRQPVLITLDSYDAHVAGHQALADWIGQQLLAEVETSQALALIIAGQRTLDSAHAGWRDLARHLWLTPITDPTHWEPWIARRCPSFWEKGAHLPTVLMVTGGNPSVTSATCEAIAAVRRAP